MKSFLFIGVDISKATLDVSVLDPTDVNALQYKQFPNDTKAFPKLLAWIGQNSKGLPLESWRVCMENTGIYNLELNCFLHEKGVWQCLENALQIKRSMGVVRGKTDKADAKAIALYAYRFSDQLRPYVLPGKALLRRKALFAQRERLIDMQKQLQLGNQSLKGYAKELVQDIQKQNQALHKTFAARIKTIEGALEACLAQEAELQRKVRLLRSVPGVGLQTAVYFLIVTRGMEAFTTAWPFACYSGCAPFAHRSGTSVRDKTGVHFIANRKMKALLHMAALNAVTFNDELKTYYQRKVAEGKNAMSVLNAVRFKLICRMFSVVMREEGYQKDYQKMAA